jgi:DNA mismatch repair protein MutS
MEQFVEDSRRLLKDHHDGLVRFSRTLGDLDYQMTCAIFFKTHGYVAPHILDHSSDDPSMIEADELRHPIIEAIDRDVLFVPHSVCIPNNMLIYGINSSGKSTFLKSVGLAVWLSQCGLFVPAKKVTVRPFHSLYTKIGSYDNLYIGHSTFITEMNELHYIFRRAIPKRTLVLCDELTAGTEMLSATGIVGATLRWFEDRSIAHVITTHLQLLGTMPDILTNKNLRICHFEVGSERTDSVLISDLRIRYDRTLRDGCGPRTYGIEIANDMGLPQEFIALAHGIRSKINCEMTSTTVKKRRSRYNKKLWMDKCFRCGSIKNLHTHHITPQVNFKEDSTIHHHDKNGLYNLIVLCDQCHEDVHRS